MRLVVRGEKLGAIGFILVYNDPDRGSSPTLDKLMLTREIRRAGEDIEVHLLDHLVIAGNRLMDINP